jgi:hypothetical protein
MNGVMNTARLLRPPAMVRTARGRASAQPWSRCTDAIETKVLALDLERYCAEVLLRIAPGYATGRQRHACEIHIFVLAGRVCNDTLQCEFGPGDHCYQPYGDEHAELFPEGAILHVSYRGEGDTLVEFFSDDGKPCGDLKLSDLATLMA